MEHLYTIVRLDEEHIDEICDDIAYQYENGIASCALFCMPLVPEGNPPVDKAGTMGKIYVRFKEKLDARGISNGILVQCTIGHGWKLGAMFPYQNYKGLFGRNEIQIVCPYDEGFKEYIYNVMRTLASYNPDHIMVDDDFRLIGRYGGGCSCPLHMKRFNELAGTDYTRDNLAAAIMGEDEESRRLHDIYVSTQKEAVIEAAKVMRQGIDSVNPKIPGSFCAVGTNAEFADEIAQILAGDGNPSIVRINNGNYMPLGGKKFTAVFFKAAAQIAKIRDKVDYILAETDTCPQNRYSTGAMSVHTHFTGTLLEGTHGAKHWITRLRAHEPAAGVAYRKVLSKYAGFYNAVSELSKEVSWKGCRIPVFKTPMFKINRDSNYGEDIYSCWGECSLERLGLPMYFSAENGGALMLEGHVKQTDAEIYEALKGVVFLASDSAMELIDRGFGEYLGVAVKEWEGKQVSGETILLTGTCCEAQVKSKELIVTDDKTEILSYAYNTADRINLENLFPASVMYKNSLGGTVITFSGTPNAAYSLTEAFSFLNYSRKQQFIHLLTKTNMLPAYYPGDEEVYFRTGDLPDGRMVCSIFNLGTDPIDETEIVINRSVSKIEALMPDGTLRNVDFKADGNRYIMDIPAYTLNPVFVFIS